MANLRGYAGASGHRPRHRELRAQHEKSNKLLGIGAAVILAAGVGIYAFSASSEEDHADFGRAHAMRHGMMGQGMMGHGMMGRHMDGPRCRNRRDMSAIHELAVDHDRIRRTVTNLPDGIRTVTESDDPRIAQLIKEHVARMGQRVRAGKMMGVPIESPAVHAIYANKDKIRTDLRGDPRGHRGDPDVERPEDRRAAAGARRGSERSRPGRNGRDARRDDEEPRRA